MTAEELQQAEALARDLGMDKAPANEDAERPRRRRRGVPKSTESQQAYRTPRAFFAWLDSVYRFTRDAAASPENALCDLYYDAGTDALKQAPEGETIWINPPFKRIKAFIRWAIERAELGGCRVVMLLPASFETAWFRHHATRGRVAVLWPRLPYVHPNPAQRSKKRGPPCASILVHFEPGGLRAANEDREQVPIALVRIPDDVMDAVREELKGAAA